MDKKTALSDHDLQTYQRVLNVATHLERAKLYKLSGDSGFSLRIGKKPATTARADGVKENDEVYIFWDKERHRFLIYTSLKDVLRDLQTGVLSTTEELYGAERYTHNLPQIHTFLDLSAHNSISSGRSLRQGGVCA